MECEPFAFSRVFVPSFVLFCFFLLGGVWKRDFMIGRVEGEGHENLSSSRTRYDYETTRGICVVLFIVNSTS